MKTTLPAKKSCDWPGETAMSLTRPCKDKDGQEWSAGTIYQPLSIGTLENRPYQKVSVKGRTVTFFLDAI
jgi:hypothetical protein